MRHALLLLIQLYRWVVSPLKVALAGPAARCRYEPSCSEYALQAVRLHGAFHGVRLTLGRVARCHPWGGCGCDPVPLAVKARWGIASRVGSHRAGSAPADSVSVGPN